MGLELEKREKLENLISLKRLLYFCETVCSSRYSTITEMKLLQNFSRGEVLATTPDTDKCKYICYLYILLFCESWQMRKKSEKMLYIVFFFNLNPV